MPGRSSERVKHLSFSESGASAGRGWGGREMSRGGGASGSLPRPCPCPPPTDRQRTCWHLIPLELTRRKAPLHSAGLKAPAVISPGARRKPEGWAPSVPRGRRRDWGAGLRAAEPPLKVIHSGLHLF